MQQSALEALADELGLAAGAIEREARLRIDAALADIARRDAERELRVVLLERRLEERLAAVKDGEPGASVTVADVKPLLREMVAAIEIPKGEPGSSVTVKDVEPLLREMVAAIEIPKGDPGSSVTLDDVAPMLREMVAAIDVPKGEPGASVTIEDVEPLLREMVAAIEIPKGEPGASVTIEDVEPLLREMVAAIEIPKGEPGASVTIEDVEPLLREMVAAIEIPKGEPGTSVTVEDVEPLLREMVAAIEIPKGEPGSSVTVKDVEPLLREMVAAIEIPKGEPGAPGILPVVKAWEDRVYYEGEVATHDGATWQASRDTGRPPPHEDWACLARAGRDGEDGVPFSIEGTFDPARTDYKRLSVVALNGGSFVARHDEPGACPGEGWQLLASQGGRGKPGERSTLKGDPGPPGPKVRAMDVDDQGLFTLTNADGSTVEIDLYPLLSKLQQG